MKRNSWSSKMGFYLVSIGSAFGLGSLWRFPYIANENGGGGFVWLYLAMIIVVGMPLLVGEILLGKISRKSLIDTISEIKVQSSKSSSLFSINWVGYFGLFISLSLFAFYSVVCGWVLHYLMQFLVSCFQPGTFSALSAYSALQESGWLQVGLTSAHILVVTLLVAKGLEEGLEKWVSLLMPLFILLLCVVTWVSLSLPNSNDAMRFFLYPNFSKLKLTSLSDAIGHSLFTLSIGFGVMVTFGSYLRKEVYVPGAGFKVATLDCLTAIFAGIIIFPMVVSSVMPATGPSLLFQSVPKLFAQMQSGKFWGVVFFLCLYISALGASTGIMESIVSNMRSVRKRASRVQISWTSGVICFLFSLIPAFSSSYFASVKLFDKSVFEFVDLLLINWLVPLAALILGFVVVHRVPVPKKIEEFKQDDFQQYTTLYKHWHFVMKYVFPGLIILSLLLQIISFVIKN